MPTEVADALRELSQREYRHPRDQAALFVAEGLRRAGALPTNSADNTTAATLAAVGRK